MIKRTDQLGSDQTKHDRVGAVKDRLHFVVAKIIPSKPRCKDYQFLPSEIIKL